MANIEFFCMFYTSTGLRPPIKEQPTTSPIFLYVITCHGTNRSFPVAQMLSQMHNIPWIRYWLSTWLEDNKRPDEIIVDESAALMGAIVCAFTKYQTTNEYLSACMNALLHDTELPQVYMRLDRSHFIKSIFRNVRHGFKATIALITGVLGYLVMCSNYREARKIIRALFTVVLNEFKSAKVDECAKWLKELVFTHSKMVFSDDRQNDFVEDGCGNADDDENIPDKSYKDTTNYCWIKEILGTVPLNTDNTDDLNIYFATRYKKYLIRTFVRLPLWSNVMLDKFSSSNAVATSTASENTFKEIKSLLDITKKKRVDSFASKHLEHLSGHLKIGIANQREESSKKTSKYRSASIDDINDSTEFGPGGESVQILERSVSYTELSPRKQTTDSEANHQHSTTKKTSKPVKKTLVDVLLVGEREQSTSYDDEELSPAKRSPPKENWGGLNKTQHKPIVTRSEKRRAHRSILSKHDPEYFQGGFGLLKNGYDSMKLTTTRTCSFDSLYVVFAVACLDFHSASERYLRNETLMSEFLNLIVSKEKKGMVGAYRKRNMILDQIFSTEYYAKSKSVTINQQGEKLIDCFTGLGTFFSQLVHRVDGNLASFVLEKTCNTCEYMKRIVCPVIPLQTSHEDQIPLEKIAEKIILNACDLYCKTCQLQLVVSHHISDIIAFEVEPPEASADPTTYRLQDIQSELELMDKKYKLFAAIEFIPNHFIAYVQRRNGIWEQFDDLNFKNKKVDILKKKMNIFMVFYVNANIK